MTFVDGYLRAECYYSRRLAWNSTLFLSGVFGVAAGAAPDYVTFNVMIALIGFSAGGNLPV